MPDSYQRKRRREYDAEIVICRHCETPRTRRDERRHLKQQKLAERQGRDALDHIDIEFGNSAHSEPAPNVLDTGLHAEAADTLSTMEHVLDQITHPELQIRRQRRLEPDAFEDDWYIQDQTPGTDETNLFGRIDPNRIDWALLPEDEPLDSPFAGLSAEEILGLGFEREMAQIDSSLLSDRDFYILNSFNYRVTHNTSNRAFEDLRYAFSGRLDDLPTIYETQARVAALSGIKPRRIDCCRNSCICYTDMYVNLQSCPSCHAPRFYSNGKPAKQFAYLPLTPRLIAMLNGPKREDMLHRHKHDVGYQPGQYTDIFGGSHYRKLKQGDIPTSRLPRRKYFSKATDVALGVASDGFVLSRTANNLVGQYAFSIITSHPKFGSIWRISYALASSQVLVLSKISTVSSSRLLKNYLIYSMVFHITTRSPTAWKLFTRF
ncbi:hypothetical protein RSOL_305530 [Rhizoctonia solani AG-3 Rhs1AP]|uniref:Transposase family Tnp2 protein n=1 Tax=Rhizoctonia solani AG-3 Rhs1AP TaxID=1086054 RepID=A0A0A1ULS8_9AGAM|nr:hypothetical protein RSOL_305530 [Rhizoctonia solani AG-3 Rhs1AP]